MKLHQLPYFKAMAGDLGRFLRLFDRLNSVNPTAATDLIDAIWRSAVQSPDAAQVKSVVDAVAQRIRAQLSDGERVNAMPMLVALKHLDYFTWNSLDRLRRVTSLLEEADDYDCAFEWLRSDLCAHQCSDCGDWEFDTELQMVDGDEEVCRNCIRDHYTYLNRYDAYIHSDNLVRALDEDGNATYALDTDDDFVWNDRLGQRVHVDYDIEPDVIGHYHSSKSLIEFKHDDWTAAHMRFFGVELEVEMADRSAYSLPKARELNDLINAGEVGRKVFFERDGSLTNGFEIVTHPMSLPAHRDLWRWLHDKTATKGLRSHMAAVGGDRSSCGLHVHVSRNSLTKLQIAKMVAFVNHPGNKEFISALARRYGEAMTGYCRIKDEKAKVGKAAQSADRYEAVNVTPRHTIEFRIFRGTLKYESLVSAIEFVHALCEYTARCGDCSVSDLGFEPFLQFAQRRLPKETETLRAYISNRLEVA